MDRTMAVMGIANMSTVLSDAVMSFMLVFC